MNICLPYVGTIRSLRTIALAAALSLAAAASADTAYRPAAGLGMGAVLATSQSATATDVQVNPEHPDRYVVVRGDTLWDIAGFSAFSREGLQPRQGQCNTCSTQESSTGNHFFAGPSHPDNSTSFRFLIRVKNTALNQ